MCRQFCSFFVKVCRKQREKFGIYLLIKRKMEFQIYNYGPPFEEAPAFFIFQPENAGFSPTFTFFSGLR